MATLKNIIKRKQLAEMIYDNYASLTDKEKKELDHEIGSTYMGYQTALGDIIQLIVDGKSIEDIKAFIAEQLNGKVTKNPFRFSEVATTQMQNYIYTQVKTELIRKGHNEEDARRICQSFIEYPALREGIIECNELKSIRICEHCGAPMYEGYLVNDFNTYCSEECAKAALLSSDGGWTEETFKEHLAHAGKENSVIYWKKWEI